jgi:hypothetical protein
MVVKYPWLAIRIDVDLNHHPNKQRPFDKIGFNFFQIEIKGQVIPVSVPVEKMIFTDLHYLLPVPVLGSSYRNKIKNYNKDRFFQYFCST